MTDKFSSSSLPPELLRDIIESSIVRTYHSTTYKQRQRTLCSLSLVSRQFRDIAQPLLGEIIHIRTESQLALLPPKGKETFRPKELTLGDDLRVEIVEELLGRCKSLESLQLRREFEMDGRLDLDVLADYTKLVNLQIYGSKFNCTVYRPFTALRSLALYDDMFNSPVARMLSPEDLPSLRALGLKTSRVTLPNIDKTKFPRLLPQLDAICLDSNFYLLTKDNFLSEYSPRILVDVPPNHLIRSNSIQLFGSVHHLRINDHGFWRSEAPRDIVEFIADAGKAQSSSLKSIYLDLSFHPSEFTPKSQLRRARWNE